MYRMQIVTGQNLISAATELPPFGPGFSSDAAATADALEVWGSSFEDAEDWVEYRLIKGDHVIAVRRYAGY